MRFPVHFRRTAFDLAIQQLRDGRPGESGYGRRIALLLTIPTFDDPVARDIRRAATGELYVVRTVWNRALDLATSNITREIRLPGTGPRSLAPSVDIANLRSPSLRSMKVPVDPQALDALLESVASAIVPCRPEQPDPPLDATVFELTFGEELSETRYRWYAEAPAGWEPLASFASRLVRLVDEPSSIAAP
jgi:hypothetical protein